MSKSKKKIPQHRNHVAMGMIASGLGKKQIFKDRRLHRADDAKDSWQKDLDK